MWLTPKFRYTARWRSRPYNFSFQFSADSSSGFSQKPRNLYLVPDSGEKDHKLEFFIKSLNSSYPSAQPHSSSYNHCFLITLNPQTNKWIDCLKSGQFAHSLIQVHVCSFRTHFYLTNSPCLNPTVFPPLSYLKCWKLKNTFLWNEKQLHMKWQNSR